MNATVQELVDALTPEEKAGLCTGAAVPRLGLPALRVNGLHSQESAGGVCFPSACAAAASFDPEAARRMGAALGREARSGGAQLLDVPDVNLKRGPLSGRSADTWAEDPCLTGALAAAFLQGVQSAGVGGCAGRLAVVNQETDRRTLNRRVDERTLQELYLPAFETAVRDGQPRAVVCSAGQLNGTRICEDTALLTDTLRGAWGFAGAVLAEPGAVQDPARTLAAGVDFAPADAGRLVDAVQSGALDESVLNRAASNIIRALLAASTQPSPADRDHTADRSLAVELAKQSGVLLRNLGALPLHKGQKVAYIGAFADHPRYSAGHPRAPQVTSAIDAAVLHGRKIHYIEGFPADRDQRDEAEFLRAVAAAEAADAAVIFAGLPECAELAAADRRHMRLPECQNNLIARVAAVQKNTVVVLHTGSPVECPWANDVNAVLCMYLGGEGVGAAADALLWGDANPSGRLPETWPLRLEDTPCYLDFPGDGRHVEYREGVYVGYRWYDARKMPVLWPFGHGLSYTGFVYRNAQLTADEFAEGDSVRVRVSVKNVGMMPGKEVVQLYVADCTGTTGRPPKELRKFVKVKLEPGEEKQVEFTLTAQDLSYYDETLGSWYAAPGEYKILLGHSSRDIHATLSVRFSTPRRRPFVIDENTTIGELSKDDRTAAIIQQVLAQAGNALTGGNAGGSEIASSEAVAQMLDSMPLRGIVNFGGPAAAGMITPLLEILRAAIQ